MKGFKAMCDIFILIFSKAGLRYKKISSCSGVLKLSYKMRTKTHPTLAK